MSFEIVLVLASLAAGPAPAPGPALPGTRPVPDARPLVVEDEAQARDEERRDREDERYDEGTEALDEGAWDRAVSRFRSVTEMKGRRADAALYWLAYAENKRGRGDAALTAVEELRRSYPQSRWLKEAKALELEVRQRAGQAPRPESVADEDLKLMALNGLMNSDPEQAIPLLEKFLQGNQSRKLQDRALFVLCQSSSPKAREIVRRIARGESQPELQRQAIRLLGVMGARAELWAMYQAETVLETKKAVLRALAVGGDTDRIVEMAKSDQDVEMRLAALRALGPFGGPSKAGAIVEIYKAESDRRLKEAALGALFVSGSASALVEIARTEKDPELRQKAVSHLADMNSKEATAFLLEILNQ